MQLLNPLMSFEINVEMNRDYLLLHVNVMLVNDTNVLYHQSHWHLMRTRNFRWIFGRKKIKNQRYLSNQSSLVR